MGVIGCAWAVTTFMPFQPQPNTSPPFQTAVTLDGATYALTCTWNLMGRWYFTIAAQNGTPIYTGGLVGSPLNNDILLAPGIFQTSTILYRESTGNFEITP